MALCGFSAIYPGRKLGQEGIVLGLLYLDNVLAVSGMVHLPHVAAGAFDSQSSRTCDIAGRFIGGGFDHFLHTGAQYSVTGEMIPNTPRPLYGLTQAYFLFDGHTAIC